MSKLKTKSKTTTIVVVSIIAVMFITLGVVSAYSIFGKGPIKEFNGRGLFGVNGSIEQEIQTAIKNGDYPTWKGLMESQLTQDNFNKLVSEYQNMTQFGNKMMNFSEGNFSGNFTRYPGPHRDQMRFGGRFGKPINQENSSN